MGNTQTNEKQLKTGKSPAKGKHFMRTLNRKSPGRESKKHGRKKSDVKRGEVFDRELDKTPDSDNNEPVGTSDNDMVECVFKTLSREGERGESPSAQSEVTVTRCEPRAEPRSPTRDQPPSADSTSESVFTDPLTPLAVELNQCYYSAESDSANDDLPRTLTPSQPASLQPASPAPVSHECFPTPITVDMPHDDAASTHSPDDTVKEEKNYAIDDICDTADNEKVMGGILSGLRTETLERSTHECSHDFRDNRLKASPGQTSFTLSKHRKVELPPVAYEPSLTLLDHAVKEKDRRPVSVSEVPPTSESNVLRKVASLTLDKHTEAKIIRPKFVPDKLDFRLYEKFEGQMLLNWFISSVAENNNLKSLLSLQDLKHLGIQYCTHLLAAGVLRQISDKDAPTEFIFKPNLMYYWAHMEVPASQPVTPGRLHMSAWPPDKDINHLTQDNFLERNNYINQNNNEEISDISEAKIVISQLKRKLKDLEYQLEKYKINTQIDLLNKNLEKGFESITEYNSIRNKTELISKDVQTFNTSGVNNLSNKTVISKPECESVKSYVNIDNIRTLSSQDSRSENNDQDTYKPEIRSEKIENYCKLNKSRDCNKLFRKESALECKEIDTEQSTSIIKDTKVSLSLVTEYLKDVDISCANAPGESSSDASFLSSYASADLILSNEQSSSDLNKVNNMDLNNVTPSTNLPTMQVLYTLVDTKKDLSDSSKQSNQQMNNVLNDNSDKGTSLRCIQINSSLKDSEKEQGKAESNISKRRESTEDRFSKSDKKPKELARVPSLPPPLPGMPPHPPPTPGTEKNCSPLHSHSISSQLSQLNSETDPISPSPPASVYRDDSECPPTLITGTVPPLPPIFGARTPTTPPPMPRPSPQHMPEIVPPPPPLPGMGPPPPPMPGMVPPPPPMPGMGPPPPPMPGMGPSPPPMPGMGPPPPPMPEMGPPPPPMPGMGPPPPPMPGMGPPPPPMPGMGPPPPPMPGMGPPPPPMPGMGPPPPPMPGMGPPPPPMPGMGPPPPPMPGMGPPPPPMPGANIIAPQGILPPPSPLPGAGPPPPPGMPSLGPGPPPPMNTGPVPFPAPPVGGWNMQRSTLRKTPVKPAAPMKPLYWTRILATTTIPNCQGESDSGMKPLWLEIDETPLDNIDEFTDLFSRQVVKAPTKKKVEVKTKIQPVKILDSKRSQNVGILAQSLHVEFSEIENAIYNFDTSVVSLEALQQIYELRANEEELSMIKEHLRSKPDIPLDRPEAFLHDLSGIPNFAERISCFMFQADFEDSISTTMHKLDNLKHTCEFLTTNESLKTLFAIILTLGNYMNGGNGQRGQADGFGLEILAKLKDVKSKQSNVTLLHFIVRTYMRRRGGALAAECALPVPEPGDVARAAALDFADVATHLDDLNKQLLACKEKTKKVIESDTQSRNIAEEHQHGEGKRNLEVFKDKMTAFINAAEEKLKTENENLDECRNKFIATVKFYQYTPKCGKLEECEPKEFFSLWTSFCSDFKDIYKKEEQIAIKEKLKEAKKLQEERKSLTQPIKEGGLKARLQKLSSTRK